VHNPSNRRIGGWNPGITSSKGRRKAKKESEEEKMEKFYTRRKTFMYGLINNASSSSGGILQSGNMRLRTITRIVSE
jgi:hypothetical protein